MSGVPAWHSKLKDQARALGLKRFASTLQCKHGHVGNWITASGACAECCRLHSLKKDKQNPEKRRERLHRYRVRNAEQLKLRSKLPSSRVKNNKRQAEWRRNNPDKRRAIVARYESKDPDRLKIIRKYGTQRRRQSNPLIKIAAMTRLVVWNSLTRKNCKKLKRTTEILGCSIEFFKSHIERQFTNGMSWENRKDWHIDHVIPLSSAATEEEVISLNHFTNLRPMFAKDNLVKGDKVTHLI